MRFNTKTTQDDKCAAQLATTISKTVWAFEKKHPEMTINDIVSAMVAVLGSFMAGIPDEHLKPLFMDVGIGLWERIDLQQASGHHPHVEIVERLQ